MAIKCAALLSIGTRYGLHEFYFPLQIALRTLCVLEQHVARLCTCASECPFLLCVMSFVSICGSRRELLGRVWCLFILTPIKHFSFWPLLRTVCNCVQGRKVLRKIFKHPLLPLMHLFIFNLTPTNAMWRFGYFCSVSQSCSELLGWLLPHWWPLLNVGLSRGLAWAGSLWQGRHFCRATAAIRVPLLFTTPALDTSDIHESLK